MDRRNAAIKAASKNGGLVLAMYNGHLERTAEKRLVLFSGRGYPELIVRMAGGEAVEPHVGEFRAGLTFTRYYWQLELDQGMSPTGRDIVDPPGPPAPR